ncbi:hypothetical protein [Cohnella zeiphila]|uniref:Uncharacterized protein n=1 Tax=Cohnella zeiphila TaxID=2761120 RepID=A0A7X0SN56_9BACL|nr:hypothetical protein [Cohnella zeiphila]MBB6731775.1 hypothetical protein [Cohnella zeiphila]
MNERLRAWVGCDVQAATTIDIVEGLLVSAEEGALTIRLSGPSGYGRGRHAVIKLAAVCYVRRT